MERADKCSIASSPAAARLPCQRSSYLPFNPLASRGLRADGRAQRSCPHRGGRNVVQKIPDAAPHTLRTGQARSKGHTVVLLLRAADGEKRQDSHRALASPTRDGEARIEVSRPRWACRECGASCMEDVPFRASGQRITLLLLAFVATCSPWGRPSRRCRPRQASTETS